MGFTVSECSRPSSLIFLCNLEIIKKRISLKPFVIGGSVPSSCIESFLTIFSTPPISVTAASSNTLLRPLTKSPYCCSLSSSLSMLANSAMADMVLSIGPIP